MKTSDLIIKAIILSLIVITFVHCIDSNVQSSRPKTPYTWGNLKKYRQILPDQIGEAYYNQTKEFKFDFDGYRTTYNMRIENYEGEGPNPCVIQQRSVDLQINRIDTDLDLPQHTFLAMHSFSNYLVTLTHEFKIFLFHIEQQPTNGINLSVLNMIQIPLIHFESFDIQKQNVIITSSYNGKLVHILFPNTMISFQMPEDDTNKNSEIQLHLNQKFQSHKNIKSAKFVKGLLFVSAGEEGIDVYRIENQNSVVYEYIGSINKTNLDLTYSLNAQDLALDYSSRLYIVCSNNGVIIYDVNENDFSKSKKLHLIYMLINSNQIAVRGDHTLVVTGQENGVYFIKEVFYDIDTNDYFINREFHDTQFKWQDVQMGDLFTFIQGKSAHRILYQGINKSLIPQEDKHSDFRQGIALQELDEYEVKQIQSVQLGETSFLAISENGIFSIQLLEIPPMIVCKAEQISTIGESKMRLIFNSTDCSLANYHSPILYNVWQMCQNDFQFTFKVHDIWIDGQNVNFAGFIAVIVILVFIILIMLSFFFYKSYKNKFLKTNNELDDIKLKYIALESSLPQQKEQNTIVQDKSSLQFNLGSNQLDVSVMK